MKLAFKTVATMVLFAAVFTGCSKQDKVASVSMDDPEMVAAIAKARETLPQFWEVHQKRERGENGFSLRVRVGHENQKEDLWTTAVEKRDGKLVGTVDSEPEVVKTFKSGQKVEIPEAEIVDWFYMREGKMVGNYTLRVLMKKMPKEKADTYKTMLAEE